MVMVIVRNRVKTQIPVIFAGSYLNRVRKGQGVAGIVASKEVTRSGMKFIEYLNQKQIKQPICKQFARLVVEYKEENEELAEKMRKLMYQLEASGKLRKRLLQNTMDFSNLLSLLSEYLI